MNVFQRFIQLISSIFKRSKKPIPRRKEMKKVLLDAGHGGNSFGASASGVLEKNVVFDVVLATGRILEKKLAEAEVFYTRIQDKSLTLQGRYNAIMSIKPAAFVSIHCNAIADNPNTARDERTGVHGVEIFFRDEEDLRLAKAINRLFARSDIWKKNRGVKQDVEWLGKRLTVLNSLEIPSVLIEIGFLSNEEERINILENKEGIADLIAHGIADYLTN